MCLWAPAQALGHAACAFFKDEDFSEAGACRCLLLRGVIYSEEKDFPGLRLCSDFTLKIRNKKH